MITPGSPKNRAIKGIAAEHAKEARDTYPVNKKIKIQERSMIRTTQIKFGMRMEKAIRLPRLVAMPLPPLNPRKIVQLWPATTVIADKHT